MKVVDDRSLARFLPNQSISLVQIIVEASKQIGQCGDSAGERNTCHRLLHEDPEDDAGKHDQ